MEDLIESFIVLSRTLFDGYCLMPGHDRRKPALGAARRTKGRWRTIDVMIELGGRYHHRRRHHLG